MSPPLRSGGDDRDGAGLMGVADGLWKGPRSPNLMMVRGSPCIENRSGLY